MEKPNRKNPQESTPPPEDNQNRMEDELPEIEEETQEVDEDPRQYEKEELIRMGYTEQGLDAPVDQEPIEEEEVVKPEDEANNENKRNAA
ncbi:MAG TPA: hypothetical protein VL688_06085 [Verrucomicrobiae bacterium]|nr:hypothetical protein [Verrucomicrobiae bacterium]